MANEEINLISAIEQAAASLWLDDLPLSIEYVTHYAEEKIAELHQDTWYSPE